MLKHLKFAVTFWFFAIPAFAADLGVVEPMPLPEGGRHNFWSHGDIHGGAQWAGLYAGVHLGRGSANYDGVFEAGPNPPPSVNAAYAEDLELNGIAGGFHAGYNWQHGQWVYGVEGDITFADWSDRKDERNGNGDDQIEGEINQLASVRGRAGWTNGPLLIYGTLGVAFADANYTTISDINFNPPGNSGTVDFNNRGIVMGGGLEMILSRFARARVEALFYDFDQHINTSSLSSDSDAQDFVNFNDAVVVRAGVSVPFCGASLGAC